MKVIVESRIIGTFLGYAPGVGHRNLLNISIMWAGERIVEVVLIKA
jgi:hypothetical protein